MTITVPVKSENSASFHHVAGLRRAIEHLFEDFGASSARNSLFGYRPFGTLEMPLNVLAVDIVERDGEYEISAEMPGMDEKEIEVKLSDGGLVIRGEKKAEKEERKKGYHLSERQYGAFERYFSLPNGVDAEKVSASFKNGVLKIALPKTTEARRNEKKIAIKTA